MWEKANECNQSPSRETDSICSANATLTTNGLKSRASTGSQIAKKKLDSQFSSTFRVAKLAETSTRVPKRTDSNCSSRDISPCTNSSLPNGLIMESHTVKRTRELAIPVIVPRNHVNHERTATGPRAGSSNADSLASDVIFGSSSHASKSCGDSGSQSRSVETAFCSSGSISSNQDCSNYSSKSRQARTGDGDCSSIRNVAERLERMSSVEQPAAVQTDRSIISSLSSDLNRLFLYYYITLYSLLTVTSCFKFV